MFCRVRPKIKEDGAGTMANDVIDYDRDDDGLVYIANKARTQTFEMDKVFTQSSTQDEVWMIHEHGNEVKLKMERAGDKHAVYKARLASVGYKRLKSVWFHPEKYTE